MSVIVWLGPSCPLRDARAALDADYRPPVRHGDVWRALRDRPRIMVVIDGVFEQVPAVWHKELLEALHEGVHVFGASSMGALRAAELHPFGMRGVGRIFEAFRDEVWMDDDEVALTHGPAEAGYPNLSVPMANVRATVAAAEAAGVLGFDEAAALTAAAKAIFHADRSWKRILEAAESFPPDMRARFESWLPSGKVDQKRRDALECLETVARFVDSDPPPFAPSFTLRRTDLAEYARRVAVGEG
jgi:hypothetical protein